MEGAEFTENNIKGVERPGKAAELFAFNCSERAGNTDLLPKLLIMFLPSTFKRRVLSWKALNLRKTLLMASSVRLKPLNCSRLPCVYAQETLTFLLTFFFQAEDGIRDA